MADTDRATGKASYFTFNGVNIPFTKITPKVTRKLADSTDSGDYNSSADMIGNTQIPVSVYVEATVEGRFRKSSTPSAIMSLLFGSATQIPVVIGIDLSPTVWGHGVCDISNYQSDIPVEDIVTFSCDIKSWGLFTANS